MTSPTPEVTPHVNRENGMRVVANPVLARTNAPGLVYDERSKLWRRTGEGAPDLEAQKAEEERLAEGRARARREQERPNLKALCELDLEAVRCRSSDTWNKVPAALQYATSCPRPSGERVFAWKRLPGLVLESGWSRGVLTVCDPSLVLPARALDVEAIAMPRLEIFHLIRELHQMLGSSTDRGPIDPAQFQKPGPEAHALVNRFVSEVHTPRMGLGYVGEYLSMALVRGCLLPVEEAVPLIWRALVDHDFALPGAARQRVRGAVGIGQSDTSSAMAPGISVNVKRVRAPRILPPGAPGTKLDNGDIMNPTPEPIGGPLVEPDPTWTSPTYSNVDLERQITAWCVAFSRRGEMKAGACLQQKAEPTTGRKSM